MMLVNAAVQAGVAINDMTLSKSRKDAIEIRAKSQRAALEYQEEKARGNVLQNQIEIDQDLQEAYQEIRFEGYKTGMDTTGTNFALAREAGKTKEVNKEELKTFVDQLKIEKLNVDLEKQQNLVSEKTRILGNVIGTVGAGISAYGTYSNSKIGSTKTGAVQSSITQTKQVPKLEIGSMSGSAFRFMVK